MYNSSYKNPYRGLPTSGEIPCKVLNLLLNFMPELPDHNKQIFFNVMSKRMSIEVFEQWVYTDQELEQTLSADSYLELISLNFKKSGVRYELFNLLQKFVGAGEYETWKLTRPVSYTHLDVYKRQPPSTIRFWPVMCPDAGDTKNSTALATSSTVAGRPIGVIRDHVLL